ncbi:MAG: nucleoside-diphosphate-sugar epimerase [Lysobacterales bacterium]|jgi:nucleoside-diphosphate-sugar epimerase
MKVSVLGCGWLGLPVARRLLAEDYNVKGSTTTVDKLTSLSDYSIKAYHLEAMPQIHAANVQDFFDSDILILTLPFRRSLKDPSYYKEQITSVLQYVKQSSIKKIIFTSSTAVYPDDIGVVEEDTSFKIDSKRSQVLWDVEQMLFDCDHCDTIVLRLAGLYGGERKLGRFLSAKKVMRHEDSTVNLVHLEDCVNIITLCTKRSLGNVIFNICSDEHPKRGELYIKAAKNLNVEPPVFDEKAVLTTKCVSNAKLKKSLSYSFIHSNPLNDLA